MCQHLGTGNNTSEYRRVVVVVGEKSERSCEMCAMWVIILHNNSQDTHNQNHCRFPHWFWLDYFHTSAVQSRSSCIRLLPFPFVYNMVRNAMIYEQCCYTLSNDMLYDGCPLLCKSYTSFLPSMNCSTHFLAITIGMHISPYTFLFMNLRIRSSHSTQKLNNASHFTGYTSLFKYNNVITQKMQISRNQFSSFQSPFENTYETNVLMP